MKIKKLHLMLIIFLILGIMMGYYSELWKQGAKKVVNTKFEEDFNTVYMEIIWDASGSMWGRETGIEKIIYSKDIINSLNNNINKDINMGLRIFGARRIGDIKDSFLAVPVNNKNKENIINFIANVKPLGKSPIAYSIKEAINDLNKLNGKKILLLLSDGIDNGDIPSFEVINTLKNNNINLYVIHIGDLEDMSIKNNLKKMTEYTGGKYFTYKNYEKIIPVINKF